MANRSMKAEECLKYEKACKDVKLIMIKRTLPLFVICVAGLGCIGYGVWLFDHRVAIILIGLAVYLEARSIMRSTNRSGRK